MPSFLPKPLPVNVLSHLPAFHSLIVLSAEPVNINPCSGSIFTAHTAAVWPCEQHHNVRPTTDQMYTRCLIIYCPILLQKNYTCSVIMHLSFNQTLAVVSHDPLSKVPNFPDERLQTGTNIQINTDKAGLQKIISSLTPVIYGKRFSHISNIFI